MPLTRSMACSKMPLSAGPASPQMIMTSPAVIRVISTQPGTSPLSSCSPWRIRFCSWMRLTVSCFLSGGARMGRSETGLQHEQAGKDRESYGSIRHMTNVALYLRQSLNAQEGIDRQRERCRAMAATRGWDVVREYSDNDVSASKPRGPETAWGKMLEDAKTSSFEFVLAVDLDRLIRSTRDLLVLTDAKIRVVTVDGEIDLSTADGEFRGAMLAAIARFEVQRKGERQKRANAHRAAAGNPGAGKRPFGWEKDRITLRESEAKWLRRVSTGIIAGESLHSLVRELNAAEVPTSQGKTWSATQLRSVILRPRNAGILVALKERQARSLIQQAVSEEDHDLVVSILTSPGRTVHRGPKPETNWLSGLMDCGVCGQKLLAKNVTARGVRERMYMCASRVTRTRPDSRRHVTITARLVEAKVLLSLYGHFSSGLIKAPKVDVSALKALHDNIAENARQRTALTELGVLPGADLAFIKTNLKALQEEFESLETQRSIVLARSTGVPGLVELFDAAKEDSSGLASTWQEVWEALPAERRRAVVRGAFKIDVEKGKGVKRVTVSLI